MSASGLLGPLVAYCYSHCSMFCCTLLYVLSSIAIILMGKRELVALLNLSSWCLLMVERLLIAVTQGCLLFVIVVLLEITCHGSYVRARENCEFSDFN